MSDDYALITVEVLEVRENYIVVRRHKTRGEGEASIPRSLLHAADDLRLGRGDYGGEVDSCTSVRVRAWKAEQLGFA